MFSKKATKIDKIFTVNLTLCSKCQTDVEDFVNFCGLLRKHEFWTSMLVSTNDITTFQFQMICNPVIGWRKYVMSHRPVLQKNLKWSRLLSSSEFLQCFHSFISLQPTPWMAKSFVHISNKLKASESKKSQGRGHKSNCMSQELLKSILVVLVWVNQ